MRYAEDPFSGRRTGIHEFLLRYGNDANDQKVFAKCFVCKSSLRVRSHHSPGRRQHFAHIRNTKCPLIASAKRLFEKLREKENDPDKVQRAKMSYIDIVPQVYLKCHFMANKKLRFKEFIALNKLAVKKGLWDIRDLGIRHIPYILLSYKDLTRKSNPERRYALRFVFVREIEDVSLLWMWPKGEAGMVKLTIERGALVYGQALYLDASFNEYDWLTDEQRGSLTKQVSKVIGLHPLS